MSIDLSNKQIEENTNSPKLTLKKDLLYFKEDILKDIKKIENRLNIKYKENNSFHESKFREIEEKIDFISQNIIDLSNLISLDNNIKEKVDNLLTTKEKFEDYITQNNIQYNTMYKDLHNSIFKYDKLFADNIFYPGIIGSMCKFKNFHELIDYVLLQIKNLLKFKDSNIIDLKNYKDNLSTTIKSFQMKIDSIIKTCNDFSSNRIKESENKINDLFKVYDERIQDVRIENNKYSITVKNEFENLIKEWDKILNIKNEIFQKFDNEVKFHKDIVNLVYKKFDGYKKEFILIKNRFTQVSEFIKDVRFRYNIKEDVKKREVINFAKKIDFSKKQFFEENDESKINDNHNDNILVNSYNYNENIENDNLNKNENIENDNVNKNENIENDNLNKDEMIENDNLNKNENNENDNLNKKEIIENDNLNKNEMIGNDNYSEKNNESKDNENIEKNDLKKEQNKKNDLIKDNNSFINDKKENNKKININIIKKDKEKDTLYNKISQKKIENKNNIKDKRFSMNLNFKKKNIKNDFSLKNSSNEKKISKDENEKNFNQNISENLSSTQSLNKIQSKIFLEGDKIKTIKSNENDTNEIDYSFYFNSEKNNNEIMNDDTNKLIKKKKIENIEKKEIIYKKIDTNSIKNKISNLTFRKKIKDQLNFQSKSYTFLPNISKNKILNNEKLKFERIQSSKIPNSTRNEFKKEIFQLNKNNDLNFKSIDTIKFSRINNNSNKNFIGNSIQILNLKKKKEKTPEKNNITSNVIQFNNPNLIKKNLKNKLYNNNNKHIQKLEELVKDIKYHIPDIQLFNSKLDLDYKNSKFNYFKSPKYFNNNKLNDSIFSHRLNNTQSTFFFMENNSFSQDKKVSDNYYYNLMKKEDLLKSPKNNQKRKDYKNKFIDLKNL